VNFDLPHVPEDYVHRIGRTGRAGATGEALSLIGSEDRPLLGPIERLINRKIEVREADGFDGGRARAAQPAREAEPRRERGAQSETRRERSHGEPKRERAHAEPKRERAESPKQPRAHGSRQGQGAHEGERGRNGSGHRSQQGERNGSSRGNTRDYANATNAPARGSNGGMDFNKPYEPPAQLAAAPAEEPSKSRTAKNEAQVPALFKRRAA